MLKRYICFFAALVIFSMPVRACLADKSRSAPDTAKEIVRRWGKKGENADIDSLREELRQKNPALADALQQVLDYWRFLDYDQPLNADLLPGDITEPENTCLAVLGYSLNSDGSMRKELIGRLQVALDCAKQYPEMMVLCTGGGTASGNKKVTEAGAMGDWLVKNGLDPARLLIEDRSVSTEQNAIYSAALLYEKAPWVTNVIIVSSDYHINWGSLLFEAAFIIGDALSDMPHGLHVTGNACYTIGSVTYSDPRSVMTSQLVTLIDRICSGSSASK